MIHPLARDEYESVVLGDHLPTSIGQFKRRAIVIIEEEQAKANPDNRLIEFACDAVRLAREWGNFHHSTLDAMAKAIERRSARDRGTERG